MNQLLNKELETVVLITSPAYGSISSTILREIYKNGGDISSFIPYSL
jgi:pantetheine-phosphate adenylyltransferase